MYQVATVMERNVANPGMHLLILVIKSSQVPSYNPPKTVNPYSISSIP